MTPQDRAAATAVTIVNAIARHVRSPSVLDEITEMLREEFHDIQQQTLSEMRPGNPHD